MIFRREGKKLIANATDRQVRRQLLYKRGGDNTFAILEAQDGSYVQMLGGGVACCLEWRDMESLKHYRAFVDPPKVPWTESTLLGQMRVEPQEVLFIGQVTEAFSSFLLGRPFPSEIQWRDVTEELADRGVLKPAEVDSQRS